MVGKTSIFSALFTNDTLIIDMSATNHMTNNPKNVQTPNSSSQALISTADGSLTLCIGEGSMVLFESLTLDYVLVVPFLPRNLLSISQITSIFTCIVTFWPSFYVFQDILTRYSVRRKKLYYLDLTNSRTKKLGQSYQTDGVESAKVTVWL